MWTIMSTRCTLKPVESSSELRLHRFRGGVKEGFGAWGSGIEVPSGYGFQGQLGFRV